MEEKKSLIKNPSFQAILTSLVCIVLGLLIGYIVLLLINPAGAGDAIRTIILFIYAPLEAIPIISACSISAAVFLITLTVRSLVVSSFLSSTSSG